MGTHHQDDLLTELVHHRGRELVSYALMICGNPTQAQDLVQEALIRVISRTRTGTSMESVEAYVRRAIANSYIDGYRKQGVWGRIRHLAATPAQNAGLADDIASRIDLAQAMQTLTPRERTVVVLRYYQDLPVSAIAVELDLNQGTVKRYLFNAAEKLRVSLAAGPTEALPTASPEVRGMTND